VAKKRKLPKADDFFGGGEPTAEEVEEKKVEAKEIGEPLAKMMEDEPAAEEQEEGVTVTEEAMAEGRRLVRELKELGDEDDPQVAAMIEAADKAQKTVERLRKVEQAVRHRPRVVPPGVTEKVTFYLPLEQIKRLEAVKLELLLTHDLKVSRSQIIEALVESMEEQIGELVKYLEEKAE